MSAAILCSLLCSWAVLIESREYNVDITLLYQGGSPDDFYLIISGANGQTDEHLVNGMSTTTFLGPNTFNFKITDIDVGTINAAYLVAFGSNDLAVTDIVIDTVYSVSETLGDLVGYNGGQFWGCEVLTADFNSGSMTNVEQEPCSTIPPPTAAPTKQPTAPPTVTGFTPSPTVTTTLSIIDYDVDITLQIQGGSTNDFFLIISGVNGQTDSHLINGMSDTSVLGSNTFNFGISDVDVGTVQYAYLVTYGSDDLAITDFAINSIYSVSESLGDLLGYNGAHQFGCEVLTVDFGAGTMTNNAEEPCVTIPHVSQVTQGPITDLYQEYSVKIKVFPQGGSTDEIFVAVEGILGDRTDFVSIGALSDAGNSGKTYSFNLNLTNVGIGAKLYVLNYGDDALFVQGCTIDGFSAQETSYDILEYDGKDPRGCHTLTCDVILGTMSTEDNLPCLDYEAPPVTNLTRTYTVILDIFEQGGSIDDVYLLIQGLSGMLSDPFNIGSMPVGGQLYSFDITIDDIGDPKAVYLVKLAPDGDDALFVHGCQVGSYSTNEVTYDMLEYTGNDQRGCGIVKCDLLNDEMLKIQQEICDIIPIFVDIGNSSYVQYFVGVDTTNIPFSPPGGTEDEVWLRIINTDDVKSQYVSLGTVMTDDGEAYSFRPNVTNLGTDIAKLEFIQFGDDDLCIDYCQINDQSIYLGLFGSTCNENDIDDNDACAVMTCDFELNQIVSVVETPCRHDVYGWNNQSHRVYTVVIDVCESGGNVVDTWSLDTFWLYLESDVYGLSESVRLGGLSDDENVFYVNVSNIGVPDRLYLLHFNNDDVCILDISVDGFEVDAFPWVASEYDCDYSHDGCNVIVADFELNELTVESQVDCEFVPSDFDAERDSCLADMVQSNVDKLFDFAGMVGIISGALLIVGILCVCGCCVLIAVVIVNQNGSQNKQNGSAEGQAVRCSIEMNQDGAATQGTI